MESRVTQLRIAPARHQAPLAAGLFGFTRKDIQASWHSEAVVRALTKTHLSIAA